MTPVAGNTQALGEPPRAFLLSLGSGADVRLLFTNADAWLELSCLSFVSSANLLSQLLQDSLPMAGSKSEALAAAVRLLVFSLSDLEILKRRSDSGITGLDLGGTLGRAVYGVWPPSW